MVSRRRSIHDTSGLGGGWWRFLFTFVNTGFKLLKTGDFSSLLCPPPPAPDAPRLGTLVFPATRQTALPVGRTLLPAARHFLPVEHPFPAAGRDFLPVERRFPATGRHFLPVVRDFPAAGRHFPLVERGFPAVGRDFPPVECGFPAVGRGIPAANATFCSQNPSKRPKTTPMRA
jgi:hypothetical protein